jgi:hypothetical protein
MTSLRDDYLFVAAIDIGRTYTGYAFSSRDDFKKDPLKIRRLNTSLIRGWITRCTKMNFRNMDFVVMV